MLKQGHLTNKMSPNKVNIKSEDSFLMLSTPASSHKQGALNWDISAINESQINNAPGQKITASRRKPVPIKSKYMESASKKKVPLRTPGTAGRTPATNRRTPTTNGRTPVFRSKRNEIDQLNREDTFTYDKKKPMTPVQEKSSKPSTPINRQKPTIKQTLGSERKPLRLHSREVPTTPIYRGRPTVKNINDSLEADSKSNSGSIKGEQTAEVSEADLSVLYHQKLQMLYILDQLELTQTALTEDATTQIYSMWKVQEKLRTEKGSLEKEVLVKEYLCEGNEMCERLLPECLTLCQMLPKFDKQFVELSRIVDSTRHFMSTNDIAKMTDQDIAELQATLKHILELLQQMGYEVANNKENIAESTEDIYKLKQCLEKTMECYNNAVNVVDNLKCLHDENLFLANSLSNTNPGDQDLIS